MRQAYPSGALTGRYQFRLPKSGSLRINLSQFDSSILTICLVNIIYFPSIRYARLMDARAVHGNLDTMGGKGDLMRTRRDTFFCTVKLPVSTGIVDGSWLQHLCQEPVWYREPTHHYLSPFLLLPDSLAFAETYKNQ